jgi:CDP-diacylglycerol--inositol 3-phosphatidyltransferase
LESILALELVEAHADASFRANKINHYGPHIFLYISAPVMAFKQYVNVIQLIEASKRLADGDIEMRKRAGLPRLPKLD